ERCAPLRTSHCHSYLRLKANDQSASASAAPATRWLSGRWHRSGHIPRMQRVQDRFLIFDGAELDEIRQCRLERLHPVLLTSADDVAKLVGLSFADEIPHGGRGDQDLECRDAATADLRDELLVEDPSERVR